MFVLTTIAKDRGWALPKNGIFTDGESSSINVQSISITTFESDTYAPPGTQGVELQALAPPAPDDDNEALIIEGEFVEGDDQ